MRHKVCKGSVGCREGIFYIQGVNHVCLILLVFPLTRQKKTAIGLEIAIVMSVQDIKFIEVLHYRVSTPAIGQDHHCGRPFEDRGIPGPAALVNRGLNVESGFLGECIREQVNTVAPVVCTCTVAVPSGDQHNLGLGQDGGRHGQGGR